MVHPLPQNQTQLTELSDAFFSHGQTVLFRCSFATGMPIEFISTNVLENLGYHCDELINNQQSFLSLLHSEDALDFQDALLSLSSQQSESLEPEYRLRHANGDYVWFQDVVTPVFDESDKLVAFNGCMHNITAQKTAESTVQHFKRFDSLTNLPNRQSLINKLNQSIINAKSKRLYGCVISINLDRFKYVNNNYGFEIGDALLQVVSNRLRKAVRPQDIVARVNADEFVCVLTELHNDKQSVNNIVEKTTLKIREIVGQTYNVADLTLKIGASCGVCIYPEKSYVADDIIKFSDIALGQAKLSGQNNIHFFDEKMHQENTRSTNLERDLMVGLSQKQLELYFQPIVGKDRNIIAFESLLRWRHPERGNISPCEFIPVAENTGLLQQLGEYVIERACEQLSIWEKNKIVTDERIKYVSVNISPNQFWHTDFAKHLSYNIESRGIDPKHLLLEITENIFIADLQDAIEKLQYIKQMGIKIALDDFGSGYSSLSYLMQLPLDIVKLDRAFIQNVNKDKVKATIIKSVCEIAKELKLKVIAEGLETIEELETLVQFDCDAYQGFYFYRPTPVAKLDSLLQKKPEVGFNDFNNTTEIPLEILPKSARSRSA